MAVLATMATLTWAEGAQAAAYSGLRHACSYKFGAGSYQSISFAGATSCAEARGLISDVTDNGRRAPTLGVSTGHTPHGTWRCLTERRNTLRDATEFVVP